MDYYEILFEGQPMTGKIWSQILQDQTATLISLKLVQKSAPAPANEHIPASPIRSTTPGDNEPRTDSSRTHLQEGQQNQIALRNAGALPIHQPYYLSSSLRASPLALYDLQPNNRPGPYPADPNIPAASSQYQALQPSNLTSPPYTTNGFTLTPAIQNASGDVNSADQRSLNPGYENIQLDLVWQPKKEKPIRFQDASGNTLDIPYRLCKTWEVSNCPSYRLYYGGVNN
jgi:hypothetical protein